MSTDTVFEECERLAHLSKVVRDLPNGILCSDSRAWNSFSSFGKKVGPFLFYHPSTSAGSTKAYGQRWSDSVLRVRNLKRDVQDHALLCLFSCPRQFPVSHLSNKKHDFLFLRKRQPTTKVGGSGKTTVKPVSFVETVKLTDQQMIGLFLRQGLLLGKKQLSFSQRFKGTSLPKVSFVNGLPSIPKNIFNSLLISQLRSAKSMLRNLGHFVPNRLPKSVVLRFSREIDSSLRIEVASLKKKSTTVKKSKEKKGRTTVSFVSSGDQFVPDRPPGLSRLLPEASSSFSVPPATPSPPPTAPDVPFFGFWTNTTGQEPRFASLHDVQRMHAFHRRLYSARYRDERVSLILSESELEFLRQHGMHAAFAVSPLPNSPCDVIQFVSQWYRVIHAGKIPAVSPNNLIRISPPPVSDALENELFAYYRDRVPLVLDQVLMVLEPVVMELRSICE
jgi:hypothetical protein